MPGGRDDDLVVGCGSGVVDYAAEAGVCVCGGVFGGVEEAEFPVCVALEVEANEEAFPPR